MLLTENDTEMYIQFSPLMANEGSDDAMCDVCIYFRVLFFLQIFYTLMGLVILKNTLQGCLGHNRLEDI